MIEELRQVDDSVLTSLVDLRRERDALRQRLARMQESASQVSAKVLDRVRGDYETRIAALEDKALPLRDAALTTFGRLKPLHDEAEEACETLRLDQEEVDLRHSLGEFDDTEHRERSAGLAESLRAARERADEIADYLARFAGAFDSLDELAPATTSQVGIPVLSSAATADAFSAPDVPGSAVPEAPGAGPLLAAPFAPPHDDDGTLMLPPEAPPAPEPPPPPAIREVAPGFSPPPIAPLQEWRPAPSVPASFGSADPGEPDDPYVAHAAAPAKSGIPAPPETRAGAHLEALDGDLDPPTHALEPLTFVGRTPENQIRIYKPAVSRRHAQITETDAGWLLRDLSSENGTYVNGQRVAERLLADGDRIQFGTSRFVLRLTT